jgi:hypothetical protein
MHLDLIFNNIRLYAYHFFVGPSKNVMVLFENRSICLNIFGIVVFSNQQILDDIRILNMLINMLFEMFSMFPSVYTSCVNRGLTY